MDSYRIINTVRDFMSLNDCHIGELIFCIENNSFYIYNNAFVKIECTGGNMDDDPNIPKLI